MLKIISLSAVLLISTFGMGQQPKKGQLRIVDTLTVVESQNRQPIILQSELDSLINIYLVGHPIQPAEKEPVVIYRNAGPEPWTIGILSAIVLMLLIVMFRVRPFKSEREATSDTGKISTAETIKVLTEENTRLEKMLLEFNGHAKSFQTIRAGFEKAYKVKNYPGYDRNESIVNSMISVLRTEQGVATYAFNKFIKPILAIADANKNHPARISQEESSEIINLLVSLSLLYIESLYLRVQDLSVGGKIVERINGITLGKDADPALLKGMNREFGSRALVVRLALDKVGLKPVHYPVFDETNLNDKSEKI